MKSDLHGRMERSLHGKRANFAGVDEDDAEVYDDYDELEEAGYFGVFDTSKSSSAIRDSNTLSQRDTEAKGSADPPALPRPLKKALGKRASGVERHPSSTHARTGAQPPTDRLVRFLDIPIDVEETLLTDKQRELRWKGPSNGPLRSSGTLSDRGATAWLSRLIDEEMDGRRPQRAQWKNDISDSVEVDDLQVEDRKEQTAETIATVVKKVSKRVERPQNSLLEDTEEPGVRSCLRVIGAVFILYGCNSAEVEKAVDRQIGHWQALAKEVGDKGWLVTAKYKIAAFYSAWLPNEVPPKPCKGVHWDTDNAKHLLGGVPGRWVKYLSVRDKFHFQSFLGSILLSKQGMPRPTKDMLKKAADDTAKDLSRKRTKAESEPRCSLGLNRMLSDEWADEDPFEEKKGTPDHLKSVIDKEVIVEQLLRTVDELFSKETMEDIDWLKPIFPSTSANYNRSRTKAGGVGEVWQLIRDARLTSKDPLVLISNSTKLSLTEWRGSGEPGAVYPIRTPFDWESRDDEARVTEVDMEPLVERWQELRQILIRGAVAEEPLVETVPLPEALKIRVISKGPALTYFFLAPLQKKMWSVLEKHPCFQLVGNPVTELIVNERMGAVLKEDYRYLSGDYKAATDNFPPWVSETIATAVAHHLQLTKTETELFIRALTQHKFKQSDGTYTDQEWGQLMGSVVSFPVLCIANAAYCRLAIEVGLGKKITLKASSLLINGDDVLLKTNEKGYNAWRLITKVGGLKESLGKCYWSREIAVINSTQYMRLEEGVDYVTYKMDGGLRVPITRKMYFKLCPHVNLGILLGVKRSGRKVGVDNLAGGVDAHDSTLGSRARQLMTNTPDSLKVPVWNLFLERHWTVLSNTSLPWYIPEWLGGLGLPILAPDLKDRESLLTLGRPSKVDLQVARMIKQGWTHRRPRKPVPGMPWKVRKIAEERVALSEQKPSLDPAEERRSERLLGLLCVEALFRKELSDIFDENPADRSIQVIRHNEKLWRFYQRKTAYPPPMPESELQFVPAPTALIVDFVNDLSVDTKLLYSLQQEVV